MRPTAIRLLALLVLGASLAGCASTRFTSAWRDVDYRGGALKKIVVLGLSEQTAARRVFEDEFSKALQNAGVEAIAGYRLLPDKPDRPLEAVQQAVKQSGADGILVARTLRTERKTQYTPGHMVVMPGFGYRNFWGYYGASAIYTEPQAYQYDVVTIETNLWPASDGKVLWSALSESTDPSNVAKLSGELAALVIGALREQQLIAPAAK